MIGCYGSKIIFYTSSVVAQTFQNLTSETGAKFADHALLEGKPRKQYIGANLRSITFDMMLRADLGISPRVMLETLKTLAEEGSAHYLIIGGRPLSQNPFVVTSISDQWGTVYNAGQLYQCTVSVSLEEYPANLNQSKI